MGKIVLILENDEKLKIKNVICAKALAENLLSLRKFADMGLGVYLDKKKLIFIIPFQRNCL